MEPVRIEPARSLRTQRRIAARVRMRRLAAGLSADTEALAADVLGPGAARLAPAEAPKSQSVLPDEASPTSVSVHPLRTPHDQQSEQGKTGMPADTMAVLPPKKATRRAWVDRALFTIEVLAAVGLVVTVLLSAGLVRRLRAEAGMGQGPLPKAVTATDALGPVPAKTMVSLSTVTLTPLPSPSGSGEMAFTPTLSPTERATEASTAQSSGGREITLTPTSSPSKVETGTPVSTSPTPDAPTGVRIAIPAIGVDAAVVEGDSWETLKYGIGHRVGSAWPGEQGNCVLSAHNDVYGAIFADLGRLEPGDLILASTVHGQHRYEVFDKRIVLPTEISVTNPTAEPIITLITCYPPLVDTHRIVVTARLIPPG